MTAKKLCTQNENVENHLRNIGPINSDEGRELYGIVDFPSVISKLKRKLKIKETFVYKARIAGGRKRTIRLYWLDEDAE